MIPKVPFLFALLLIVASLSGCGSSSSESREKSIPSQESTPPETAPQLPFNIEGIKEQVCTSGYFFLDFQIKNISTNKLDFSDFKGLGLEVLLKDKLGNKLVTLPVGFYGSLTPGLNVTLEPNSRGTLTVVNDGFKGTLGSIEVQVDGKAIYEAPADFPAPARGRNWVIKDGMCS